MCFWIFNTLKNKTSKVRSTNKQQVQNKIVKETCYKPKAMKQEDYVCHDAWTYDPK